MSYSTKVTESKPQAAPVSGGERVAAVDVLRGFAIFGILMVNIYGFSGMFLGPQSTTDRLDRMVMSLVVLLFQAKFYSLFSFLFGWGMSVQLQRALEKGANFVKLYSRRMLALLLIGLIHGLFIWAGDILTAYAILGTVLLLFRNRSPRPLLVGAGLSLLLSIIIVLPGHGMQQVRDLYEQATAFMRASDMPAQSILGRGTYAEINQRRMAEFITGLSWIIYWAGSVFAMMLLGLYAGKRRILQDVDSHLPLIRRTMWLGLIIGLAFNALFLWFTVNDNAVAQQYERFARVSTRTVGAPALMLFYASALVLLMQKESWRRRLAPLAPVGRMALSNYLLQSILVTMLFYGYGLRLFGQISPTVALIVVIVIYFIQIRISAWWMERFRFGPAEWVWRSLTYGRFQLLRKKQLSVVSPSRPDHSVLRRLANRANPMLILAMIWIFLVAWAGILYAWNGRLSAQSGGGPFVLFGQEASEAPATGTPVRPVTAEPEVELLITPVVRPLTFDPAPVAAAGDVRAMTGYLDLQQALRHIETLSGASFAGRLAGSPGGHVAGEYIADMFAQYRLQPAAPDGTFFQSFPITYTLLLDTPQIEVILPDGAPAGDYEIFRDFNPVIRAYAGGGQGSGSVHWVNQCRAVDFADLELLDKIVFCRPEPGSDALVASSRLALEYGASGLLLLTDEQDRPPDFADRYQELWVPETIPVLRVYQPLVDDLLTGSGLTADELIRAQESQALETQVSMWVETSESTQVNSRNVLGVLPGRDPDYADDIVIVGAHYDHMGMTPDGTQWSGANDNASGVAAVLEIARSWQEVGFVPRRTVLFAAWDAEEWGLFGSRHYVEHPSYPLEDTLASIQMDMVGAGGDTLAISGDQTLAQQQYDVTQTLDVEAMIADMGRSDHVPFLEAGVPATLLIWYYEDDAVPHYHRPVDLPGVIEPQKLAAVMNVANTALLDLVESQPAIEQLVAQRTQAALENDPAAFLSTSGADQLAADGTWFADLQTLDLQELQMSLQELEFQGALATAEITIDITHGEAESPERILMSQPVHFMHGDDGWRWAGPALSWYRSSEEMLDALDSQVQLNIGYPMAIEADQAPLARVVSAQYAELARRLGLPENGQVNLMLMPDSEAIRFSTAPSLPAGTDVWVEPGLIKLVYSEEISRSLALADTVVQVVLADAGVSREMAPWLWPGLPIAWRAAGDIEGVHNQYLPALVDLLAEDEIRLTPATSWAAVEYLIQKVGWQGVGGFIQDLGQACAKDGCDSAAEARQALASALQMDVASFHRSWQEFWSTRLNEVQANLDRLLLTRAEAVLAGDEASFLATVDANDPYLISSEGVWFSALADSPPAEFSLAARPITLFANGDVRAEVTMDYLIPGREPAMATMDLLFTASNDGYRWAGPASQTIAGELLTIRFPDGQQALAQTLLQDAEQTYATLAETLAIETPQPILLELYPDRESFQVAIGLGYPTAGWLPAWSQAGSGIKMQLLTGDSAVAYQPTLANQLARNLLYQKGIVSEWLLKGIGAHMSIAAGNRVTHHALAASSVQNADPDADYLAAQLLTIPPDEALSDAIWRAETAKAWDSTGYLIASKGWPAVLAFIDSAAETGDVAAAFDHAFGRSLSDFEQEWMAAAAAGSVSPEWLDAMTGLDVQAALNHVTFLGGEKLSGRQAGTPGSEIAAGYIAQRFAEYGLLPAGDMPGESYFQSFPITYTVRTGEPALQIVGDPAPYVHRADFLSLYATRELEPVLGELVWLGQPADEVLDLSGKIALMMPGPDNAADLELALAHHASGLLLLGNKKDDVELFGKQPLAQSIVTDIPAQELTLEGTLRLIEILDLSYNDVQNLAPGTPLGVEARLASSATTKGQVRTTNVLGLLPGNDPLLSQQVFIVGAHYDHVGDEPASPCEDDSGDCPAGVRYSGLNDNASGVAVMLEIARFWQEIGYRPRHSILFAAWGAQELGQLGSEHYIQAPTLPMTHTIAMLQLDGLGGGEGFHLGLHGQPGSDDWLILTMTSAAEQLDQKVVFAPSHNESDHLPFSQLGMPSLLVSWRLAGDNNLPDSLANGVSPEHLATSQQIITLTLMMLAR